MITVNASLVHYLPEVQRYVSMLACLLHICYLCWVSLLETSTYLCEPGILKMRPTRLDEAYHIEKALAAREGIKRYPCGCKKCHGYKTQSVQTVEKHHRKYGRDSTLEEPLLVNVFVIVLLQFMCSVSKYS